MRIALVVGYLDWFSGDQETALAQALAATADVEVIASDRVGPNFSDSHLGTPALLVDMTLWSVTSSVVCA